MKELHGSSCGKAPHRRKKSVHLCIVSEKSEKSNVGSARGQREYPLVLSGEGKRGYFLVLSVQSGYPWSCLGGQDQGVPQTGPGTALESGPVGIFSCEQTTNRKHYLHASFGMRAIIKDVIITSTILIFSSICMNNIVFIIQFSVEPLTNVHRLTNMVVIE